MARRPLVAIAACWAAGTSIWSLWSGREALLAFAGTLLLLAACALRSRADAATAAACACALLLAGGERLWADARNVSHLTSLVADPDGRRFWAVGRVASPVSVDGDIAAFKLRVSEAGVPDAEEEGSAREGRKLKEQLWIRVKLTAEPQQTVASSWRRGDEVRIEGELQKPATAGNFGGFDYGKYLKSRRIHWVLSVKGAQGVEPLDSPIPWSARLLRWTDEARDGIGGLMDTLYDGTDAGYMKGLVAGIQDDLDPAQFDSFSRLGLTHVIAVSGMHFGVFAFILLKLFALLRLTRERALELTIAAMPVYMLLTGASPSAIRACIMGMIALYMARRDKLKDGLHLLSASLIAMLAWDPLLIENVSFQLSFVVTAGLLLFAPIATRLMPVRPPALRAALAVAVTAQAASFPLSVYYFHQFHLLSLPANLVLVPFISFVVMPLGMASAALGAVWHPLGSFAAEAASWCNRLVDWTVNRLGEAGGMQTYWPQPSVRWVLLAYALLLATAEGLKRRHRAREERERWAERRAAAAIPSFDARRRAARVAAYAGTGLAGEATAPLLPAEPEKDAPPERGRRIRLLFPLVAVFAWSFWLVWGIRPAAFDRDAKVMFLDVGQGDSILIRTGEGRYGLVDAGGTVRFGPSEPWRERRDPYEVGKKTIVPLLKQRGVRSLDVFVLTHLDQDHIGGAEAVLNAIPVRRLVFNGSVKPDGSADRLFRLAEERDIPIYSASEGMEWKWDASSSLTVLAPEAGPSGGSSIPAVDEQNDRSVVLLLSLYGRTFLLPGDLEAPGERRVLASPAYATAPVDVLKAGHHGSKTSSTEEWLRAWNPREAVISAGRSNLYGHPHPAVLERLETLGIAFFRTDIHGEIQYRIAPDGKLERRTMKNAVPAEHDDT
ncbi:hypothetical protein J19TS2_43990 [Cohnella xylanilytica]|uniref:ComEC/Rec2 family competence protein n=1 Tax=Cohnella xylanilytica TaxID=557555 RepID=A0A841U087_9BACL|nr:ComEC/Rec2 family competence protein [Cohnella xylanilytica]MBB6692608.1 ComEC/Rec2 family competence protein [Cohnella xylanilytica]GIO14844.1 hypothetical protein J19TS2_43990 [Cohnella xylanilytica]